jgi:pimeloyl-ACP methyl ester carboxylesterase
LRPCAIGDGFYMIYFQEPGVADQELGRDVRATLRRFLYGASGDAPTPWQVVLSPGGGFLDTVAEPDRLPSWLSEEDLDDATAEVKRSGFTGGLSWYRNIDRGWALTRGPWHKAPVLAPALFIAGDRDAVITMGGGEDAVTADLRSGVPNLRDAVFLPGCGHWTQQERPSEVNEALTDFLRSLPPA